MEKDVSEVWSRKRKIAGGSTPEYGVHWAERVLERFPFEIYSTNTEEYYYFSVLQ